MKRSGNLPFLGLALAWSLAQPAAALACSACFGASDSSMARGMNFGILTLLIVVLGTLGALGGFFIYLARRAAALDRNAPGLELRPSNFEPGPPRSESKPVTA